jgi:hypothetical protein
MTQRLQKTSPMVRAAASLDPNHRRRKLPEKPRNLLAPQPPQQNRRFGRGHTMQLKDML